MAERIDLSDIQPGAWAELRPAPWGLLKEAVGVKQQDWVPFTERAIGRVVTGWNVQLPDGTVAPLPKDLVDAQRDDLDARIMLRLSAKVGSLLRDSQPDPNAGGASSASSSETPTPAAS